jgi:hypothetical protein
MVQVERTEDYENLPRAYRVGLRLQALGADTELIADCLEIEPESVRPLLAVALAKLKNAQRRNVGGPGPPSC